MSRVDRIVLVVGAASLACWMLPLMSCGGGGEDQEFGRLYRLQLSDRAALLWSDNGTRIIIPRGLDTEEVRDMVARGDSDEIVAWAKDKQAGWEMRRIVSEHREDGVREVRWRWEYSKTRAEMTPTSYINADGDTVLGVMYRVGIPREQWSEEDFDEER